MFFVAVHFVSGFQSSPSIQRETSDSVENLVHESISILSLYTEGDDMTTFPSYRLGYFNPLPLYRGRPVWFSQWEPGKTFQSSPSIQRETVHGYPGSFCTNISILSLYTEGDLNQITAQVDGLNFNPLPLYRGRPTWDEVAVVMNEFQSSPSIQRETEI